MGVRALVFAESVGRVGKPPEADPCSQFSPGPSSRANITKNDNHIFIGCCLRLQSSCSTAIFHDMRQPAPPDTIYYL